MAFSDDLSRIGIALDAMQTRIVQSEQMLLDLNRDFASHGVSLSALSLRIQDAERRLTALERPPVPAPTPTPTPVPTPVPVPTPTPVPPIPGAWTITSVQALIDSQWQGLGAEWLKPELPRGVTAPSVKPTSPVLTEGRPLGQGLLDKWYDQLDLTNPVGTALLLDGSQRILLTRPRISADFYAIWANQITDLVVIDPVFTEIRGNADQSLFRLVNPRRVFVYLSTGSLTDSTRHTFRIHGAASDIHLIGTGAGPHLVNGGIMMVEDSIGEDTGMDRCRIKGIRMRVTQPGDLQYGRNKCRNVLLQDIISDKRGLTGDAAYSGLMAYPNTGCQVLT